LTQTYIIAAGALLFGFVLAWILQLANIAKLRKELRSTQGFLESEKLMKETLKKENSGMHQMRQAGEGELIKKLQEAQTLIRRMDEDILLLQKSNEETERQLASSQPELHNLKLKMIEAQNVIARYKSQLGTK
jgi:peptidoglycan hydrolase CwlO-like protein